MCIRDSNETGTYWLEVETHNYVFDRQDRRLAELDRVTKQDFITYFKNTFLHHRKSIELHAVAEKHRDEYLSHKDSLTRVFESIHSVKSFHRSVGLRRNLEACLLYTSPSPRDRQKSRMPSSA
eukprot:TRINITY_DN3901_c0_g3_i3.p1 TRINITY_DN3901_c0_g3~~TRINITY_DN3901_c0_g3_i3.p1  ORF type:complete len:123 (-),score=23.03 TRINITY_DN3901_c0_g3_i3:34-402(-)